MPTLVYLLACSPDVNYTPRSMKRGEIAITHYSLGKIVIDGKKYNTDITIFPNKSIEYWKTDDHNLIQVKDIRRALNFCTTKIIIGIGAKRKGAVGKEVADFAKQNGIELCIINTYDAVRLFNHWPQKGLCAFFLINN